MTAHTTFAPTVAVFDPETRHRRLVKRMYLAVAALVVVLGIYGADYYSLDQAERPFSVKHSVLRPSGVVGINMGLLGVLMFCAIFLYPLRKRWAWLRRRGDSKHWLDYHSVLGMAAPVAIAFHASFKFGGLAGIAFWVMLAVALSGFVGRYLYGQIPQRVKTDELSLMVLRELLARTTTKLGDRGLISASDMQPLLHVPTPGQVAHWPLIVVLGYIVTSDVARPFLIARIRVRAMSARQTIRCLGGLLPGKNSRLEWVLGLARRQAVLSRRIVFLSRVQRAFQLWHVIHRPFSYAFAVLALFHIVVAMLLGFV